MSINDQRRVVHPEEMYKDPPLWSMLLFFGVLLLYSFGGWLFWEIILWFFRSFS